jgi:hypothetical protein
MIEPPNTLEIPRASTASQSCSVQRTPCKPRGFSTSRFRDNAAIGTFSDEDLAKGVNLADYETPMRFQAQW